VQDRLLVLNVHDVGAARDHRGGHRGLPGRAALPDALDVRVDLTLDRDVPLSHDFDGYIGGASLHGAAQLARVVTDSIGRRGICRKEDDLHERREPESVDALERDVSIASAANREKGHAEPGGVFFGRRRGPCYVSAA
jgi:hypothetical protein